jgi:hypothetical protein
VAVSHALLMAEDGVIDACELAAPLSLVTNEQVEFRRGTLVFG